jgi:alkylation response protein AidB-like acyl-CoA dehydrogenase
MRDDLQAFAEDVRTFVRANLPRDLYRKVWLNQEVPKGDFIEWQRVLADKGWFTGHWPLEYGGLGWSAKQRQPVADSLWR